MQRGPLYVFDGHCVLCSRGVAYILKHETQPDTRFIAILSGEGRKLAAVNNIAPENPESFLYITNGKAYQKSDAVLAMLRDVGGPAKIIRLGKFLPRFIRDFMYGMVAKNRYRVFGRTEMCYVPSPETRGRFVLE